MNPRASFGQRHSITGLPKNFKRASFFLDQPIYESKAIPIYKVIKKQYRGNKPKVKESEEIRRRNTQFWHNQMFPIDSAEERNK